MQRIDEYFRSIQDIIASSKIVASSSIEYVKVLDAEGYVRGALTLIDGSELRILEYTIIRGGQPIVSKYRFQWQRLGEFLVRWNNAPHHPEVETHPYHKHVKGEERPRPSEAKSLASVLVEIEKMMATQR